MTKKAIEKKSVSLIIVALGIVCTIFLAGLTGAVVNYTSVINGKDSTIATKNSQISSLESQVSNLQNQVNALNNTHPVQFTGALQLASGNLANGATYFYVVPNGTRLAIEFVSARVDNLDSSDSIDLRITTTVNGVQVQHYLGVAGPQGRVKIDPYSQAYQFVSQEVRIYADAGSHVSVEGNRLTRTNNVIVVFSFSGYLVDVP
jgi:outer membrane murein-binding lipoprotein Lpp